MMVEFKVRLQVRHPGLQTVTTKEAPGIFQLDKIVGFIDLSDTPQKCVQLMTIAGSVDIVGSYEENLLWYNECMQQAMETYDDNKI